MKRQADAMLKSLETNSLAHKSVARLEKNDKITVIRGDSKGLSGVIVQIENDVGK